MEWMGNWTIGILHIFARQSKQLPRLDAQRTHNFIYDMLLNVFLLAAENAKKSIML